MGKTPVRVTRIVTAEGEATLTGKNATAYAIMKALCAYYGQSMPPRLTLLNLYKKIYREDMLGQRISAVEIRPVGQPGSRDTIRVLAFMSPQSNGYWRPVKADVFVRYRKRPEERHLFICHPTEDGNIQLELESGSGELRLNKPLSI